MEKLSPHWGSEKIYFESDDFFEDIFRHIPQAQRHIRIEFYIFEKAGPLSERLFSLLREAVQRQVQVQLLIDGVGSPDWNASYLEELKNLGIQSRIFRPYPWVRKSSSPLYSLFQFYKFRQWFPYLNVRNHRKTVILDDQLLFTGSSNFCSNHLRSAKGEKAWRDTNVRVQGSEILKAIDAFEKTWVKSWDASQSYNALLHDLSKISYPHAKRNYSSILRLNYYPFLRHFYYHDLLRKLAHSKQRIWITNAYFIPVGRLLRLLRRAKKRGVDVKIILPYESDVKVVKWVSMILVWRLIRIGIEVYEYLPSILHAKTLMVDNFAMVGSSNFNYRSVRHDLEIDVVVEKPESLQSLENQFQGDLKKCEQINPNKRKIRHLIFSLLGQVFYRLKQWM